MTKQTIITFAGTNYVETRPTGVDRGGLTEWTPLDGLTGPQLIELYNLVSSNLGRGRVKRFADTKSALRRTWGILVDYEATVKAEEGDPAAADARTAAVMGVEPAPAKPEPLSEKLIQAAAAARKPPARAIWRRAKREEPSRVAYRPADNTVQGKLYALLTTEGGITMEAYCEGAAAIGSRDKTLFTPAAVWGALRYLFVSNRGYGLSFDGEKLQLLVPADERQPK